MDGSVRSIDLTDKATLVFGLRWSTLDPFESRHRQIQQWRAQGYAFSAGYRLGPDEQAGLAKEDVALESGDKGRRMYSAAALVATLPRTRGSTCLVLLQGVDEVYVVGLQDGRATVDMAVPYDEVASLRSRFAHECIQHDRKFMALGLVDSVPELGPIDEEIAWEDLINHKIQTSSRIVRIRSTRVASIAIAALALATVAAAVWMWNEWRSENLLRLRRLESARINDPARLFEAATLRLMTDPKGMSPAAPAFRAIRHALGSVSTHRAGWRLSAVRCEIAADTCKAEWAPDATKLASFDAFINARPPLPESWISAPGPELHRLSLVMPISFEHSHVVPVNQQPTFKSFLEGAASTWQRFASVGLSVELKAPQFQALPPNVPLHVAQSSSSAVSAASWSIGGKPWWLSEVFDASESFVALDNISLSFTDNEANFSAEGKIYVRN